MTFTCQECIDEEFSHYEKCGWVNCYGVCVGKKGEEEKEGG